MAGMGFAKSNPPVEIGHEVERDSAVSTTEGKILPYEAQSAKLHCKAETKSGTCCDIKLDGKERGLCELAWGCENEQGVLQRSEKAEGKLDLPLAQSFSDLFTIAPFRIMPSV